MKIQCKDARTGEKWFTRGDAGPVMERSWALERWYGHIQVQWWTVFQWNKGACVRAGAGRGR